MNQQATDDAWPVLEENDPPLDVTREKAAYERERERLMHDHLGQIALVRHDEVVGVFPTVDEALLEGYRRFGYVRMFFIKIGDPDGPEFIPHVDINHPSFRRREG